MKNDCHYHTLYHNERTGYVIHCTECENIQIGYGNMMITLRRCDFACFKNWVADTIKEQPSSLSGSLRNIVIPITCEGIKFIVSPNELAELGTMLESADNEFLSLEMMRIFESN